MKPRHAIAAALLVPLVLMCLASCGWTGARKMQHFERGKQYFAVENYEKAELEFRNALQIDQGFYAAQLELGRTEEKLGKPGVALRRYLSVMEADKGNLGARLLAGRLYVLGGVPQKALDVIDPVLAKNPANADMLTVRAAARAELGDTAGALADAEEAYRRLPDDSYAVSVLAGLRERTGQADQASALVKDSVARHPESRELREVLLTMLMRRHELPQAQQQLAELVRRYPNVLAYRYRLAELYVSQGDVVAAERSLREACAVAPENNQPKLALLALIGSQRGVAAAEAELGGLIHQEPHNYELRLLLGLYQERDGKDDQAQKTYQALIDDASSRGARLAASDRLAVLRLRAGDSAGAAKLLAQVLYENPHDADALLLRAKIADNAGDATGAIVDLRSALRDQPNSVPILQALASTYVINKQPALALEPLQSALQTSPKDTAIRVQLARLLEQLGNAEQARVLLLQAVADTPGDIPAQEALLHLQTLNKDYEGARTTATAIAHNPSSAALGNYLLGLADQAAGRTNAATQDYETALAMRPDAAEPLVALVSLEVANNQAPQALQRLDAIIARSPANFVARNLRGHVLEAVGRLDDAIRAYEDTIAKEPGRWITYQNLARCQLLRHDPEAAVAALERGVSATQDNPKLAADNQRLAANLAVIYELRGEGDKAIAVYEGLAKRNPESAPVAANLAVLLVTHRADAGSLARARSLAAGLAKSNNPAFTDTMGWVAFKTGDYERALSLLTAAEAQDPESLLKRYHLGMAQLRAGNRAAARTNIEFAVNGKRPFFGEQEAKIALSDLKHEG